MLPLYRTWGLLDASVINLFASGTVTDPYNQPVANGHRCIPIHLPTLEPSRGLWMLDNMLSLHGGVESNIEAMYHILGISLLQLSHRVKLWFHVWSQARIRSDFTLYLNGSPRKLSETAVSRNPCGIKMWNTINLVALSIRRFYKICFGLWTPTYC
jgi:hypothetical protein